MSLSEVTRCVSGHMAGKKQTLGLSPGLPGSWGCRGTARVPPQGRVRAKGSLPLWKTSTLSLYWHVRMTTVQSTPLGCSILAKADRLPEARDRGICDFLNYHTLKLFFYIVL